MSCSGTTATLGRMRRGEEKLVFHFIGEMNTPFDTLLVKLDYPHLHCSTLYLLI